MNRVTKFVFVLCTVPLFAGVNHSANSQTVQSPVRPTVCSGQLVVNTIDAVFCAFEGTGVNLDSVTVESPVAPVVDAWQTSWRPTQMNLTVLCVADTLRSTTIKATKLNQPSLSVTLIELPAITGRACWLVQ